MCYVSYMCIEMQNVNIYLLQRPTRSAYVYRVEVGH